MLGHDDLFIYGELEKKHLLIFLLFFFCYVLATYKVIWGRVPTCDWLNGWFAPLSGAGCKPACNFSGTTLLLWSSVRWNELHMGKKTKKLKGVFCLSPTAGYTVGRRWVFISGVWVQAGGRSLPSAPCLHHRWSRWKPVEWWQKQGAARALPALRAGLSLAVGCALGRAAGRCGSSALWRCIGEQILQ